MNKKGFYVSPEVVVFDARVERGFQGSNTQPEGLSTQRMQGGTGSEYQWN